MRSTRNAAVFAGSLLALFLALTKCAPAHEWYPWECCAGHDCAALPAESVRTGPAGYTVIIAPGGHPQWGKDRPTALTLTVPYRDAKPSPDGKFHICLNPQGALLCFFQTIGGV